MNAKTFEPLLQGGIFKTTTESFEQTLSLAESFSKILQAGDVVALEGELGSGKTVFVKGICVGLGLKNPDEVKSPTFVLTHIYETRIPVYHFDLYRLDSPKDLASVGIEEFSRDPHIITCVEWAQKGLSVLPPDAYFVTIQATSENSREFVFKSTRKRS